jgi:hypothetical protein
LAWKTSGTTTAGTDSLFDGAANTAAMVTAGIANHPAANFCVGLSIGGYSDWYMPARYEMDIAYFNLKSTTAANNTNSGSNIYSVPRRNSNYTASYPAQTALTAFNTSAEAFPDGNDWSSSQYSVTDAWAASFGNGGQFSFVKTQAFRVRAFRRIVL